MVEEVDRKRLAAVAVDQTAVGEAQFGKAGADMKPRIHIHGLAPSKAVNLRQTVYR